MYLWISSVTYLELVSPVFVAWLVAVVGEKQRSGLVPEAAGGWGQTGEAWGTVVVGTLLVVAEGHSSHSAAGGEEEGLAVVATGLATLHPGNHVKIR